MAEQLHLPLMFEAVSRRKSDGWAVAEMVFRQYWDLSNRTAWITAGPDFRAKGRDADRFCSRFMVEILDCPSHESFPFFMAMVVKHPHLAGYADIKFMGLHAHIRSQYGDEGLSDIFGEAWKKMGQPRLEVIAGGASV